MSKEENLMLIDRRLIRECLFGVTNAAGFVARFRYQLECFQYILKDLIAAMAAMYSRRSDWLLCHFVL